MPLEELEILKSAHGVKTDNAQGNLIVLCKEHHMEVEKELRQSKPKEKRFFKLQRKTRVMVRCQNSECGKLMELIPCMAKRRVFCSRACYFKTRVKYPELVELKRKDKRAYYRAKMKMYYGQHKNDPHFIALKHITHKKWYEKNKEKILKKNYERWKEKYRTDPEFRKKSLERWREHKRNKQNEKVG